LSHESPPFLPQGLNQGIRDAANLAWKLSAVLRGAPDELLDTYEVERRPNVREVIATTKMLGRLICERDPRAATERNRVMQAEVAAGAGTRVRQALLPPIRQGLIAYDERMRPVSGAGEVCPQPWIVENGKLRRLDDVMGEGFYVLIGRGLLIDEEVFGYAAAIRAKIARLEKAGQARQIGISDERIIVEADHVLASWMSERMAMAIVVRPDHSVFGTASDGRGLKDLLRNLAAAMGMHPSTKAHTKLPLG
jgi:3-(3-hydroxy-phenyl)propionate hydroxylase